MIDSITPDEIAETFTPLLNELPQLLSLITNCLNTELKTFDHNYNRIFTERRGIQKIFTILQKKWTLELLYLLLIHQNLYFNQIKRLIPEISNNILSQRLKTLEKFTILFRKEHKESIPLRVCYELTDFGRNFAMLLIPALLFFITQKE